jgi:hypothetical protein
MGCVLVAVGADRCTMRYAAANEKIGQRGAFKCSGPFKCGGTEPKGCDRCL